MLESAIFNDLRVKTLCVQCAATIAMKCKMNSPSDSVFCSSIFLYMELSVHVVK